MYFFKVLLVSLTTVVLVCAAREVKTSKKASETSELSSDVLQSDFEEQENQSNPSTASLPDQLPSVVTEVNEDDTQPKDTPSKSSPSLASKRKTVSKSKNSVDGSSKLKKSSAKLLSSDKLSTALTENSEDDAVRSKKSIYRQARFEQFPQNPMQYIHTPAQTTTVCIVVRSQGHNHPVTLCGPQTNGSESDKTFAHEIQQTSPAVPSKTQHQNEPTKLTDNLQHLPKSAVVQQQMMPRQNIYRVPVESRQKPVYPSSASTQPSTINLIETPTQHKQYPVPPYTLNQNPIAYSSSPANVITSNVPLSLNCHLQPAAAAVPVNHYLTSGQSEMQAQELYHKPGDARSNYGQMYMEQGIPRQMYFVPNTQRSASPMFVLPDGSPIEGAWNLESTHFERASQDLMQPTQHGATPAQHQEEHQWHMMNNEQNPNNIQTAKATPSYVLQPSYVQWQQPTLRSSLDTPVGFTGHEQIPQGETPQGQLHSYENMFSKSAPEYITHEYLRQWDDAYHQVGRASEGPTDGPSISYVPLYFHVGEEQYKSDDSSSLKATNYESPLTEDELKKKALMQELEIKDAKKKLDFMKTLYQASEEKLARVTAESKKKLEETSMDSPKADDLDKPKTNDQLKKDTVKTQDKRQTKKVSSN